MCLFSANIVLTHEPKRMPTKYCDTCALSHCVNTTTVSVLHLHSGSNEHGFSFRLCLVCESLLLVYFQCNVYFVRFFFFCLAIISAWIIVLCLLFTCLPRQYLSRFVFMLGTETCFYHSSSSLASSRDIVISLNSPSMYYVTKTIHTEWGEQMKRNFIENWTHSLEF